MLVDKDATLFLSGLLPEFLVRALAGSVPEFRILRLVVVVLASFLLTGMQRHSLMIINILLLAFFLAVQTTVKAIAGAVTCCSRSALCV